MKEMGIGSRVVNYLVDTFLAFLLSYGLFKWYMFYVKFWAFKFIPYYVFFFGSIFVYYFIFESLTSRTPGKWLTFTRVRNLENKKPHVLQIFIRSIARITIIDPFFIPFFQRPLHDQLSSTRVVEV